MPDKNGNYDYGTYYIAAAELLTLPQMVNGQLVTVPVNSGDQMSSMAADDASAADAATAAPHPVERGRRKTLVALRADRHFKPFMGKRPKITPVPRQVVPPPPPPVSGVGVMDVGQGNCVLLLDQTPDPIAYYDVGYPLWFYVSSLPNNMRFGNAMWAGPITQNQNQALEVVLSHWDWDHWRLGRVAAGLDQLHWTVPNQPIGPVALNFLNRLNHRTIYGNVPSTVVYPSFTLYKCNPPPNAAPAMLMNNSGIAMQLQTNLPIIDPVPHTVLLTGDANFACLPIAPVFPDVTGIMAVHHGSNAHGAAAALPAPAGGGAGRIAYSYGITAGFRHCYGFPAAAAVMAYNTAGWTSPQSTVEGANLNAAPVTLGGRGNVRMGNQAVLHAYNATAFAAVTQPLT